MIWKGNEIKTIGDLMNKGINQCKTKEEAQEFMRLYRAENPHADENIGYLIGYYPPEEMARIQDWFGVSHPKEKKAVRILCEHCGAAFVMYQETAQDFYEVHGCYQET